MVGGVCEYEHPVEKQVSIQKLRQDEGLRNVDMGQSPIGDGRSGPNQVSNEVELGEESLTRYEKQISGGPIRVEGKLGGEMVIGMVQTEDYIGSDYFQGLEVQTEGDYDSRVGRKPRRQDLSGCHKNPGNSLPIFPYRRSFQRAMSKRRNVKRRRRATNEMIYGTKEAEVLNSEISVSDEEIENRNIQLRREAEETWNVSSKLGIVFEEGKETAIERFLKMKGSASERRRRQ